MLSLFKSKQKLLSRACLFLICCLVHHYGFAQGSDIRGRVTDDKGVPLPGVTVKWKGESSAVDTDGEGFFQISPSPGEDILVFSFIGFEIREINVGNQTEINVTLREDVSWLDEVVVVAYGAQKRSDVVGSVAQISGEEIRKAPAMNITNALAGRLPGLTSLQQSGRPGADDATLRVRGVGTYGANQGPLIIIDGVQRPSFSHLDASEIESITLLKDAVSTAVYGLQAANGIILITTRRGAEGKPTISYDGSVLIGQNTRFPEFLDGPDYMEWYNRGIEVDNDYLMQIGTDPVAPVYSQELIEAVRNGTNTNPLFGNTDWIDLLMGENTLSQHHSVTLSGGNDRVKYFNSLAHLDQDGVIANTGFKRYNVRSNIDAKLSSAISVSLDLGLRQQNTHTPGIPPDNTAYMNPFFQVVRMLPNMPTHAPNGIPLAYRSGSGWVSPISTVEQSGYQHGQSNVFQGNITFNVAVPWVEGLSMKLLTSYDKTGTENKGWTTPYPLMGRDRDQLTGDFIELDAVPGIARTTLRQSYGQNNRQILQPSISYARQFDDHSFNALFLYEWSRYRTSVFSAGASNFPLVGLHEIDYGSTATDDLILPTGSSTVDARAGYVGRVNYGYKGKYLAELAARYDASVNFPQAYRWQLFPAAGLGWNVSEEDFFKDNVHAIEYLKFKASIGQAGNDRTGNFGYLQTYALTSDPVVVIDGTPQAGLYTSAPPNTNIRWETSTTTNVGFESIWFGGKLGFDFEWFYRVTKDILGSVASLYPPSIGGYFPASSNIGIMDNRGFDLQIRHNHRIGEVEYGVTGNLNWAKNKIIRLDESDGTPYWQRMVGQSLGTKIGFVVDGMYQTWDEVATAMSPSAGIVAPGFFRYRDLNGDGQITRAADMTYIGRSNLPELMFGLNLDLKYKGFDFSALFQGAALTDVSLAGTYEGSVGVSGIDDNTSFTRAFYGYGNSPYYLVENAWRPDNPDAEFPRLSSYYAQLSSHNAHINSGWIRNGAYLRLKAAQLGYSLPRTLVNGIGIQQLRIYATGSNLFTWDHLKYMDPEMPNVNNGFYPQQRIFSFGANLTF